MYNLNVIKDIKATSYFLDLDDDVKRCNIEPFDECITRHYIQEINKNCKCLPIGMKSSGYTEVKR